MLEPVCRKKGRHVQKSEGRRGVTKPGTLCSVGCRSSHLQRFGRIKKKNKKKTTSRHLILLPPSYIFPKTSWMSSKWYNVFPIVLLNPPSPPPPNLFLTSFLLLSGGDRVSSSCSPSFNDSYIKPPFQALTPTQQCQDARVQTHTEGTEGTCNKANAFLQKLKATHMETHADRQNNAGGDCTHTFLSEV